MSGLLPVVLAIVLGWQPLLDDLGGWREQRYRGRTTYAPVVQPDSSVTLLAMSHGFNSAMLKPVALDPEGMRIRWRWRTFRHPEGADPEVRHLDDRAAGVLVVVRRSFWPWRIRALLYQWTPSKPAGLWSSSPYSNEVKTVVVETAPGDSLWRSVERDVEADLVRAFGTLPERIEAIGVICDADNTGDHAEAEFGAITVDYPGRKESSTAGTRDARSALRP